MTDLRDVLARPGAIVSLGSDTYELDGTVRVAGRTLIGSGATIMVKASRVRARPALIVSGNGTRLLGDVTVVGPMPDGNGYDPTREAQHAIQVDGATNSEIAGWTLRNVFGDAISVGTVDHRAHAPWTHNLSIHDITVDEIGRHAINIDALDHGAATRMRIGRVNMAVVDIEPPGHPWGCRYFAWTDSLVNDSGGGFVLASKGVGTSDSVHDITLSGIVCSRRLFNVQINPPEGTRRQRFSIRNCGGAGKATSPVLNFRRVDGVNVEHITQKMHRGVQLIEAHDCTDVVVDGRP